MSLIVDASVAVKWFVLEDGHEEALAVLAQPEPLRAPDLIVPEVGNIAWKKRLQGSATELQARTMVLTLPHYLSALDGSAALIERALEIALALQHPVYDSLYLALAESLDTLLVTADQSLVRKLTGSALAGRAVYLTDFAAAAEGRP